MIQSRWSHVDQEADAEVPRYCNRAIYLTIGIAIVSIVGLQIFSMFRMPDIRPHVGDGEFRNHSWRYPGKTIGIPVTGYTIRFQPFALGQAHEAAYRVEQLPEIGKDAVVYFCIHDRNKKWRNRNARNQLNAAIEIDIVDDSGQLACQVNELLAKMIWADPEGGPNTYGLYLLPESRFVPRRGETYHIRVRYTPDPKLTDLEGFLYIRCGGSI